MTVMAVGVTGEKHGGRASDVVVIGAPRRLSPVDLRELYRFRELAMIFVWRDLKVRYKQSVLGGAWAVIQPLMVMVIFTMFFGRLIRVPSEGVPYALFAFSAILIWQLFARIVTEGSTSIASNQHLMTKVYFPRLLLPLVVVVVGTADFLIAALGLVAWVAFGAGGLTANALWAPFFVGGALVTAFGVTIWLSALDALYRDVRYLVGYLVQFWFFATPVVYPPSLIPEGWAWLYHLNPMSAMVTGFRWSILGVTSPPDLMGLILGGGVSVVVLVSGLFFFRWMEIAMVDKV